MKISQLLNEGPPTNRPDPEYAGSSGGHGLQLASGPALVHGLTDV